MGLRPVPRGVAAARLGAGASAGGGGWEIGSHTCSHPRLTTVDGGAARPRAAGLAGRHRSRAEGALHDDRLPLRRRRRPGRRRRPARRIRARRRPAGALGGRIAIPCSCPGSACTTASDGFKFGLKTSPLVRTAAATHRALIAGQATRKVAVLPPRPRSVCCSTRSAPASVSRAPKLRRPMRCRSAASTAAPASPGGIRMRRPGGHRGDAADVGCDDRQAGRERLEQDLRDALGPGHVEEACAAR